MSSKKAQLFNVYAGDGVYLSAMSGSSVSTPKGPWKGAALGYYSPIKPLSLTRAEAVRACHVARAQGVPAWLVACVKDGAAAVVRALPAGVAVPAGFQVGRRA